MPVPKTTNVGTLRKFFKREHPEWSEDQVLAAALNTARRSGAKIKKAAKYKRKQNGSKITYI